jgi:hypothetical protein
MASKPDIFKGEDFEIVRVPQHHHEPEFYHITTNGDNQAMLSLQEIEALAEWILVRT